MVMKIVIDFNNEQGRCSSCFNNTNDYMKIVIILLMLTNNKLSAILTTLLLSNG